MENVVVRSGQSLLYANNDINEVNKLNDANKVEALQHGQRLISNHQLNAPKIYGINNERNEDRILQSKKYHRHKLDAKNKDRAAARGWMIAFLFTLFGLIVFVIYYRKCKLKWQLQMLHCNDECEQSLNQSADCNTPLLDDSLPVLISNGINNKDRAVI